MLKNYNHNHKKIIIIIGIIVFIMVTTLVAIFCKPFEKRNTIYFFIDEKTLEVDEKDISSSFLDEIKEMVKYEHGYDVVFSYDKNEYKEVDFANELKNKEIYLIKIPHMFKFISFIDDNLEVDIGFLKEYKYKTKIKFSVIEKKDYKSFVYLNNVLLEKDDNFQYEIEILQDITLNITCKEIVTIASAKSVYEYNGYPVRDLINTSKEIDLNFLNIEVYKDSEMTELIEPIYPGKYYLKVEYIGSEYIVETLLTSFEIINGKTYIIDMPEYNEVFEGNYLEDVKLLNGKANVEGVFKWKHPKMQIDLSINQCEVEFIPDDRYYDALIFILNIDIISLNEQIRVVQEEREAIIKQLESIDFENNSLPHILRGNVMWFSDNTLICVSENDIVTSKNLESDVLVTFTGIITYGNAVDYVTFTYLFKKS